MKKQLLTLALLLLTTVTLQAQTRLIAVKGKTTNTVVRTLDEAIEVAKAGDRIYLPGGSFHISDTLKKTVHIIGTGYNDKIPRATLPTHIFNDIYIGKEAKGTIIEGVSISSQGNFHIYADQTILRRCKIGNSIYFKSSKGCQIINCITRRVIGRYLFVHNSFISNSKYYSYDFKYSEINNSIINYISYEGNVITNSIYGYNNSSTNTLHTCLKNSAVVTPGTAELRKIFKTAKSNSFFDLTNDYHLQDSIAEKYPNLGIYKGQYPWKDGGQPITPHIEENNSYLDVQEQKFKLRVKVKAQSK